MELKEAFGAALKDTRLKLKLTQEDFSLVSSRTNVSLLERGGTSPTLDKLEALCTTLGIHPVTLMAACYMRKDNSPDIAIFMRLIERELRQLEKEKI
jgi:transcriptional regulator with XRE-family HTH domain